MSTGNTLDLAAQTFSPDLPLAPLVMMLVRYRRRRPRAEVTKRQRVMASHSARPAWRHVLAGPVRSDSHDDT